MRIGLKDFGREKQNRMLGSMVAQVVSGRCPDIVREPHQRILHQQGAATLLPGRTGWDCAYAVILKRSPLLVLNSGVYASTRPGAGPREHRLRCRATVHWS